MDLMTDGDVPVKKMMLEMLFEELPEEFQQLKRHYTSSNWPELKAITHKMKSTLTFVGNPEMISANNKIEDLVDQDFGEHEITDSITIMEGILPLAMAELRKVYEAL